MEYMMLIVLIVLMGVMMFYSSRKAKKQQQERQAFRTSLAPGTEVITIGGLIGKVVEVDEQYEEIVLDSEGSLLRFSLRTNRNPTVPRPSWRKPPWLRPRRTRIPHRSKHSPSKLPIPPPTRRSTKVNMSQTDIHVANAASMSQDDARYLISLIRTVPDFPREGILFRDFMPVFADSRGLRILLDALIAALPVHTDEFDAVAGLEARGFLFGPALAAQLGKGFIAIRKAGKLPPPVHACSYALEYGKATLEIEDTSVRNNERILIVDDLIATGGSAAAAKDLIESAGGKVAGYEFVMELEGLDGRTALGDYPYGSLLKMPA